MNYEDLYFLRTLNIFKKFQLKKVLDTPLLCKIVCFEAGEVVVAKSNESDWIYIVKSGSLSVLGCLQNVKPAVHMDKKSRNSSKPEAAIPYRKRRKRRSIVFGSRAPTIVLPTFKNKVEMDMKMAATLPGYFSRHDRLGILDYGVIKNNLQSQVEHKPSRTQFHNFLLPLLDAAKKQEVGAAQKQDVDDGWVTEEEVEETTKGMFPKIKSSQKIGVASSGKLTVNGRLSSSPLKLPHISDKGVIGKKRQEKDTFSQRIQDLDLRIPRNDLSKEKGRHVYILIRVLQKGQHFGLTDMVFYDQPSVSLVSNGAECIMISKVFYRQNVPPGFMYNLQKTETPLPSMEDLQERLQAKVDWQSKSKGIYRDLVYSQAVRERRRKQHGVFPGEYNHRAGPL